jgi:hypothetical protein
MKLGTTVVIEDTISVYGSGTVSEATVDVFLPDGTKDVTAAVMTDAGSGVWYYLYQSSTAKAAGEYKAVTRMTTSTGYVSEKTARFPLKDDE